MDFAGLRLFQRTSRSSSFIIASYHRRDSITWRWGLGVDFRGRVGFSWWNPRMIVRPFIRRAPYGEAGLCLGPTVWRCQWQPHMARKVRAPRPPREFVTDEVE